MKLTYTVLLALLGYATVATACSPAQKENIDKLRKYFGIEPFYPNGDLGKNGWSNEFIGDGSDLNCNFNTPEGETQKNDPSPSNVASVCKWKNIPNTTTHELDSEDWYLFVKSDSKKKWNVLKPRRSAGKQTPAEGDGFALSGGERVSGRDAVQPQAVLYSSPLKCLETDAKLEFDYWVLSRAKVQLVLLAQDTLEVIWTQPESTECTSAKPRSGRCSVTIPAQTEPFHIGIHSYDLATAFTIIDNIEFVGELGPGCVHVDDPFDFGGSTSAIGSRGNAGPITTASDLNAGGQPGDFWSNSGEGDVPFVIHSGVTDADKWKAATGESTVPDGSFFYAEGNEGEAHLMSDVIDCQNGDGVLTFKAWMSDGARLQVCVVDKDDVTSTLYACETVVPPMGNQPYQLPIYGPLENARIMFIGSDWDAGNGGFVAVDDIEYDALLCSEETVITTTPIPIDEKPCEILSTDFDDETLQSTMWRTYGTESQKRDYNGFPLVQHSIDKELKTAANTHISCPGDKGKCAGTLLNKEITPQVGILESRPIKLAQDRYLEMTVRRGTYGSMMHLCVNTPPEIDGQGKVVESGNCQRLAGPELTYDEYRHGRQTGVMLPKNTKVVYIVSTNPIDAGAEKAAFLVDNISLLKGTDQGSGPLCPVMA